MAIAIISLLANSILMSAPLPPAECVPTHSAVLPRPPSDAERFSITAPSGRHGHVFRWQGADGAAWGRETQILGGHDTDIALMTRLATDGSTLDLQLHGSAPAGPLQESVCTTDHGRFYITPVDRGRIGRGEYYFPYAGLFEPTMRLAETLIKKPRRTISLAPAGRATMTPLDALEVSHGEERKRLTLYALEGLSLAPTPIWVDGESAFGLIGYFAVVPEGWEDWIDSLRAVQDRALSARSAALAAKIASRPSVPVVFSNVRMFDAERRRFLENMTVVAARGRIIEVGPAASFRPLRRSLTIDGKGRTLVPGLWDSHQHFGSSTNSSGFLLMASGITSVRDPGLMIPADTLERKRRMDSGLDFGPRIVAYRRINGVESGQRSEGIRISSAAEAIAAVREAHAMGFAGVKLYNSLDPQLVPVIADEARRLGLRVGGHVPRSMRALEALRGGYEEINHLNFLMMQTLPQSIIDGPQPFWRLVRELPGADLSSVAMQSFVAELARRRTLVDPTLALFESGYLAGVGEMPPAFAPYGPLIAPVPRRALLGGAPPRGSGVTRDMLRASFPQFEKLLAAVHAAGVPIVAGTDGLGIELVRELELYAKAGMTPAEALASATIVPARAFGAPDRGVIAVGKTSDLVLVDGDPSRDLGALRQISMVLLGDRLMRGDDLRRASGLSGVPR